MLTVADDIRDLLSAPKRVVSQPFLDRLDSTLTDGYAQALQLEAERLRIERRIAELVAGLPDQSDRRHDPELVALSQRLMLANENIDALRALLASLRERRTELRNAA